MGKEGLFLRFRVYLNQLVIFDSIRHRLVSFQYSVLRTSLKNPLIRFKRCFLRFPGGCEMSTKADDFRLMQRVAAGERGAVEELYDRFAPLVFKSARQVLSNNAEAEDAVQEIYLRLWQTADRYDPRRAKLVTWVMLLTRRHSDRPAAPARLQAAADASRRIRWGRRDFQAEQVSGRRLGVLETAPRVHKRAS